jgi:hypothetical protein
MNMVRSCSAILLTAASLAITALPASALVHGGTSFDLGVNTSRVPFTSAGVSGYLASLPELSRSVILSSCTHYLSTPSAASSEDTLDFCNIAINQVANGTVRTFGAVTPLVVVPAAPAPLAPTAPSLRPNCTLPHYTVDPTDPCY